jgi:hypothetical protein
MLGIYLFQRFLNKLDDYKFENIWQNKILKRQRFYWLGAVFYYFFAVGLINKVLLFNNDSLLLSVFVTIFVLFIYGSYFGRSLLKFIALNNRRFMILKSGFTNEPFTNSSFSKDNVVG